MSYKRTCRICLNTNIKVADCAYTCYYSKCKSIICEQCSIQSNEFINSLELVNGLEEQVCCIQCKRNIRSSYKLPTGKILCYWCMQQRREPTPTDNISCDQCEQSASTTYYHKVFCTPNCYYQSTMVDHEEGKECEEEDCDDGEYVVDESRVWSDHMRHWKRRFKAKHKAIIKKMFNKGKKIGNDCVDHILSFY